MTANGTKREWEDEADVIAELTRENAWLRKQNELLKKAGKELLKVSKRIRRKKATRKAKAKTFDDELIELREARKRRRAT